mmetsp:Transcript_43732/g.64192  ORF Transcript_43732/g.64192 Transcript_43732/m.64192 type:complete len:84 (-) Transcript_43732:418-669(-)
MESTTALSLTRRQWKKRRTTRISFSSRKLTPKVEQKRANQIFERAFEKDSNETHPKAQSAQSKHATNEGKRERGKKREGRRAR